jgi:glutamate-ammonia-ligase adenylyltransferase
MRLSAAHALLLARGLDCTLDRRSRRVPRDDAVEHACGDVRALATRHGLDFDAAATAGLQSR